MDIGGWLRGLGLDQYEAMFRESKIDAEVLPELTESDLSQLGVPLGHRKRLLKAIAALGAAETALASASRPLREDAAPHGGERRQLTVMFCDLVGSTALSEKLDPEELRSLLHAYRTLCGDVIARYDGFVARYVGDGILTYFGWPTAHEEDAERAVRTALEIIDTVKRASSTEDLSVRIGIATGPVVVGEVAGTGDQSKLAVGSTPNLAARLQALAVADQIVIAASTRRLAGSAFELTDLGEHDLKGIAEPVHAWRVERALMTESRFDAHRGGGGLTPLVGRTEELDLLLRRWSQARDGEGQVVLLSGEPGIGKSRILSVLRERLEVQGVQALRFQCSPYYVNSAFWPLIDNFERTLKFTRDETADAKLDKLEALIVMHYGQPLADVRFVAAILSIPCEARYGALSIPPQKHKDETLRTLVDIVEAAARRQSSMMLFEDAHWADPTTLEVLDLLIDRVKTVPLLVVLTHRPEFQSRWSGHGHVGALNLSKLTRAQSAAMVSTLAGDKALPAVLLEQILTRTDGVPLFVEELTKSILESGELKEAGDHYDYAGSARAVTIPTTLRDSLMARLDRFMPVKEIAQIGAAIGREFSYELIATVAPISQAQLDNSLVQLTESALAFRLGTPPDAIYTFKHVLVHDAAYDSLLKNRRLELHGKIARAIEARFPNVKHSAMIQAAEQFRRALDLIASLPATPALRQEEIKLQVALITPLLYVSGYTTPDTRAAVEKARLLIEQAEALGEPPEDPLLLFSVLYGFWAGNIVAFNGDVMCELAVQLLALADKHRATGPLMTGHRLMGLSLLHTGDIADGRVHLDRAITLYDSAEHRPLATRFGQDVGAASLFWRSVASWLLGYPQAALADTEHAIKVARETGHSATLMYALNFSTWTHIHCGNYAAANALVDEFIALKDQTGSLFWGGWAMTQRGCILASTGKAADAVKTIRCGLTEMRSSGTTMWMPLWFSHLAKANAEIDQFDDAWRCIGEAMTAVETTKETWYQAEVTRIAGEVSLVSPERDVEKAEAYFERALAVAREQQAKSWELRAAMSMARQWRDQDRRRKARDLLAPVYGWFTEGFDTKDLQEAKSLLAELG